MIKLILDGALFSECEMLGSNSYGMVRIAEEVVKEFMHYNEFDISFVNTIYSIKYDNKISADRVFVAPLAASKELFFPNKNREEWVRAKRKYGLPDNYFLSVSSSDYRKNLPHLIKCFSQFLLREKPHNLFLVLTGNFTYSYAILDKLNIDKAVRDKIIITNRSKHVISCGSIKNGSP